MTNFQRVIRLSLRYRITFVLSLVCAVLVAVLWGGNITAIYPVVDVVSHKQSLHDWVLESIQRNEAKRAELALQTTREEQAAKEHSAGAPERLKSLHNDIRNIDQKLWMHRWLNRYVIAPYMPKDPFSTLAMVLVLLMLGTVVKSLFMIAHQLLAGRLALLATMNLRKEFYRHCLRMDLERFSNEGNNELMSRFTYDLENIAAGLADLFGKFVREPLKMVACFAGAALISWRLLLFSLILAPLAVYLIRWLGKMLKSANRRAMEEMSQMYAILEETFQGMKVVKAFTMERYERHRFHLNSKKYYRKAMRICRYDSITRPVTELMGIGTICLAIMAGAYLVLNDETHLLGIRLADEPMSWGVLVLFYGLLAGVSDPARKMSDVFSRIQRASAASDRVYQLLDQKARITDSPDAKPLRRHQRDLVFENIQFRYGSDNTVLEDINLRITFGETLAIVGPNGCGKSTLVNLIPRFFDPSAGMVKLDGLNLRDVRMRDLRRQIGLVSQETMLFDDTVFNNIRYGTPHATKEQIFQAAKQAHAHNFIEDRLSNGYETMVGPRGSSLSGGQRQRISLARAILRNPPILILDEATSQIDLESEQVIQRVLEEFVRNRTTFLITHRMATLALADRIVVMNAGRILAVGTHDELLRRCDLYRRLHDIQFQEIA